MSLEALLRQKRAAYNRTHRKLSGPSVPLGIEPDLSGFCAVGASMLFNKFRTLNERVELVQNKSETHCYLLINGYLIVDVTSSQFGKARKDLMIFNAIDADWTNKILQAYYTKGRVVKSVDALQKLLMEWPLEQQPNRFNIEFIGGRAA